MSEQSWHHSSPDHFALLPPDQHEQLAALGERMDAAELAAVTDNLRMLVTFSTSRVPAPCGVSYGGDPAAYLDTAVTEYREARTAYPVQTRWQHDQAQPGSPETDLLQDVEAATDGSLRREYAYLAHRSNSQLSGSGGVFGAYFPNTLRVVSQAPRMGADAAYFRDVQSVAQGYLDETAALVSLSRHVREQSRALRGIYAAALREKSLIEHRSAVPQLWHLSAEDQLAVGHAASSACMAVIRYADQYGSSDKLAALANPRLVRPTTELVAAMSTLSDIGRRAALQAFLDEGTDKKAPPFPAALQEIPAEYREGDEIAERRALTLETLWNADIGDEIAIGEPDDAIPRKVFDAEIESIIEGTAVRLYAQQGSDKPRRNYAWEVKSARVADKLMGQSHARITNLRVRRLDPQMAEVDKALPENIRFYEISVELKSSGRPAILTAIQTAVYCREADRHIEMRRSARGRASGAKAIARQLEQAKRHPRRRMLTVGGRVATSL